MSILDIFKTKQYKEEIENLHQELEQAQAMLTPEMKNALTLENKIAELTSQCDNLSTQIKTTENTLNTENTKLEALKSQVLVQEELIELETFALYSPRYSFANSEEYKSRLDHIRQLQKTMVKNGTAATGLSDWTVNGNKSQGRKMVNDTKKLCLRAFNVECDSAIAGVKFNNIERCEARIRKSFDAVQKLGTVMKISITNAYLDLKIQELYLAHEYAVKKQEEKEYLRELRAQEREAARAQKELDEARKEAVKEQQHYINAIDRLKGQIASCSDTEQLTDLQKKLSEITISLNTVEANLSSIDYRIDNQRAGYVYIISNIGAFGENVYKIGMTRRLEPMDRVNELGDASVPFPFDVHALIFSDNAPSLEAELHSAFANRKLNLVNQRREFFQCSLEEIKK